MFSFLVFLFVFWGYFLTSSIFSFNQGYFLFEFIDEVTLFIVYMLVFVLFISYIYSLSFQSYFTLNLLFISMLLFCYGVFSTSNLFLLYLFYESSLIPILYIILKWGSYPERSVSAVILLVYTSIFTFPFMVVLFSFYVLNGSFSLTLSSLLTVAQLDSVSSLIIFITFAVKLPVYGLHFWLPIAHVEAPTFGSIILAGVLLKLGGVGLLRCVRLIDLIFLYTYFSSYLMVFMLYVTVVCMFQSDLKRLVAYSSVSHMMAIPILLLANNIMSVKSLVIVILFHGLSSPILFMLVGVMYSIFSSRQLIVIRGVILTSPLLSFMIVLAFFFTLSAPPFPSFVAEVYFFISSYGLTSSIIYVFILFSFMSLVYNLNWLSAIVFSTSSPSNIRVNFTYLRFIPLIISFMLCVPLVVLIYLF